MFAKQYGDHELALEYVDACLASLRRVWDRRNETAGPPPLPPALLGPDIALAEPFWIVLRTKVRADARPDPNFEK